MVRATQRELRGVDARRPERRGRRRRLLASAPDRNGRQRRHPGPRPTRLRSAHAARAPDGPAASMTSCAACSPRPHGRALYRQRQATIEPVFGQLKFNRQIRRFQRRGRAACRSEWRFIAATHNLLKLPPPPPRGRHRPEAAARRPRPPTRRPPASRGRRRGVSRQPRVNGVAPLMRRQGPREEGT